MDEDGLRTVHRQLNRTIITHCDFKKAIEKVKKDDYVFLDPPYTVAHNINGFIEYNQKIFTWMDQRRLANCVKEIIDKGAFFLMTNASHSSIKDLYKGIGKQYSIERFSTISGNINSRFKIAELIITNCNN